MSKYHVKLIASDKNGARYETVIKSHEGVAADEGFQVYSALFGDGAGRYDDVTTIVQAWGRNWPENWEEVLYAERKPKAISVTGTYYQQDPEDGGGYIPVVGVAEALAGNVKADGDLKTSGLVIHTAHYGVGGDLYGQSLDVTPRVRELVKDGSLDIVVNNSTLTPNQNPYRGKKKRLFVRYSYGGGEPVDVFREEKDWLIIGQAQQLQAQGIPVFSADNPPKEFPKLVTEEKSGVVGNELYRVTIEPVGPMSAPALNDYLIRKFSISPQRLRGPMPIELREFHRNDLAQLFAELGFKRGAEIGVAEGKYSEVLLKANPECELLLVDPWHHYSDNPQGKSKERHEFAYQETLRRTSAYDNVRLKMLYSMEAVATVKENSLDFVYIDGNHSFDFVMQDLIEWSKRVRSGGIVSGDDYYALDQKRWVGGGVVEAVQAYTNAHRIPIWWLFAGHKSVDFMWVKP